MTRNQVPAERQGAVGRESYARRSGKKSNYSRSVQRESLQSALQYFLVRGERELWRVAGSSDIISARVQ